MTALGGASVAERVAALGPWFHNMEVGGVRTAPDHFLGDYPHVKFRHWADRIPADLTGRTVLDIGCNGGFFALEMKRRGADRVVAVDTDERYLAQARLAAEIEGLGLELRQMSVYDVATLGERFDVVLFLGVLYHLRHPLLALDLIREHVARDTLVFQSMQRGSRDVDAVRSDYPLADADVFAAPEFPRMHFIEHRYGGDPTNWWIPNRSCVEALLRSAGFTILEQPEDETYICQVNPEVMPWSKP